MATGASKARADTRETQSENTINLCMAIVMATKLSKGLIKENEAAIEMGRYLTL